MTSIRVSDLEKGVHEIQILLTKWLNNYIQKYNEVQTSICEKEYFAVKLYEVSAKDRNTLVDFVQYLGQRHFHPIKESKFSLSKKLKSEKSNAAILMDL
ncbi:hypothetical protein OESDEN_00551 [Oesophagostomum dentatum]|uniref:Uncharacterized protein n=1 Tax=Oesophagostomum dentatum TaxID=61180 RepID=A0A0B1TUA8_OESDE|nr:hypothetical protein OESDEN_00551 [Oesophagostomum dentatum]